MYFDLVDHEKVRNFRIQKQMPFSSFKVTCFQNSTQVIFMVANLSYYSFIRATPTVLHFLFGKTWSLPTHK
jgi:hypothetical protein